MGEIISDHDFIRCEDSSLAYQLSQYTDVDKNGEEKDISNSNIHQRTLEDYELLDVIGKGHYFVNMFILKIIHFSTHYIS